MEGEGGVGGWERVKRKRKRLEEEREAWPPTGVDRYRHVHAVVIYRVAVARGGETLSPSLITSPRWLCEILTFP